MADRKWNAEQLLAINAESGTLLIAAAAGSGKTSVLVERIVRKLTAEKDPCAPDELLVVTFTNAAAAEMRARIYMRLSEVMNSSPEEYRRLSGLRARLDEMQVCTMDSFCMRLVREHFHACGVEPDFTILDSGDEAVLRAQAVAETIEQLYVEDYDNFEPLARLFESGRNDRNLTGGILKLSAFSMSEPSPDDWLDRVADHFSPAPAKESVWGRILTSYIADAVDCACGLCEKIADELSYLDNYDDKYADFCASDRLCLDRLHDSLVSDDWNGLLDSLRFAAQDCSRRFPADRSHTEDEHRTAAKDLRDRMKDILKRLPAMIPANEEENEQDVTVLRPVAEELIKAVKIFNKNLAAKKKERSAYSFADISHFALSLLADELSPDGKTPLAAELSEGLREILIDEYQDTNRAQDTLFTCLSKNGENMFMVGDVKQSIYRFRLASPEIFIEKCESYPYYDGKAKRSKIILSHNYRSRRGITEAVNFVFSGLMSKKCGEIVYNDDEKLNYSAVGLPERNEPDTEFHLIRNTDAYECGVEAEYIAEMIKERVENGLQTFDSGRMRPAVYADFCILLRSTKGIAELYAAALRKRGIPVCLDSREGFFRSAEIRMAVSLLRAADDPSRDVDLLAVMMSPVFGFSPDEAARLRVTAVRRFAQKKYSLYNALRLCAEKDGGKYALLLSALNEWRSKAASENAASVLRYIYDTTALMSIAGSMSDGELRKANLRTLQLAADKYCAAGAATLFGFVRYLDNLRDNNADIGRAAVSSHGGGVTIMTVHRSKGLEFPFVVMAGLCKRGNNDSSELTVNHELGIGLKRREKENIMIYDTLSSVGVRRANEDAEISEELRIYYVAMTRAREKLFIVAAPKKCEENLRKLQLRLPASGVPAVYDIKNAATAWEWFAQRLSVHPDASVLRTGCTFSVPADFPLGVVSADMPDEVPTEPDGDPAEPDEALVDELTRGMDFTYRFAPIAAAASKHTASDLSSEHFTPDFFGRSVPAFMYSSSLTPAERGTATHRFMQYCDFTACETDTQGEIDRLVSSGRLTAAQGGGVDTEAVAGFFTSDVYERIRRSDAVWRERQFTVARSLRELDESVPEEFADEKTVVIGKIDLLFTEADGAVIVDYKTDDIDDIRLLRTRYKQQMDMYIDAVRRSLGLEVKECILYSIKLRKHISV